MESCFFYSEVKQKGCLRRSCEEPFFSKRPLYSTPLLLLLYYYYNINEPGCSNNCHRVTTSHMQVSMPALAPLPLHTFTQEKKYLWKNFFVLLKKKLCRHFSPQFSSFRTSCLFLLFSGGVKLFAQIAAIVHLLHGLPNKSKIFYTVCQRVKSFTQFA